MHNIILTAVLLILGSASASAQFYTITKEKEILPEKQQKWLLIPYRGVWELMSLAKGRKGLTCPRGACETAFGAICPKSLRKGVPRKELPALTIPNLYQEIIRNGIRHPKIVLAQAILETGWFRSPLCRNRHNLFGLTNPKTGKYYEFNHWTESVRAYYTKVQYRYGQRAG